jgi:PAS domain S-box-containing protein
MADSAEARTDIGAGLASPGPRPPRGILLRLYLVLLAVFVGVALLSVFALFYQRSAALVEGQHHSENLALLLGEHLNQVFAGTEAGLGQIERQIERVGGPHGDSRIITGMLSASLSTAGRFRNIFVLDRDGVVTQGTVASLIGQSRADRDYFKQYALGWQVSTPVFYTVHSCADNHLVVPIGRKIRTSAGEFDGVVVAEFDLIQLQSFYRSIDIGPGGSISLLLGDGRILVTDPASHAASGEHISSAATAAIHDANNRGPFHAPLRTNAAPSLTSFRRIRKTPLFVAISLADRDVLAQWQGAAEIIGMVLAALALSLMTAGALIKRELIARFAADERIKQTDTLLYANRRGFQAVLDNAPFEVAVKDVKGRFLFVNRAFEQRWMTSEEAVRGKTAKDFWPKSEADLFGVIDNELIESRSKVQHEVVLHGPSGSQTMLFVRFPVVDTQGNIEALGSIVLDVTAKKEAEAKLIHAQKMEALGQLTGGIAHDFNNLLSVIIGNAELLALQCSGDLGELAQYVLKAAERGADLTKRLLAFARRQMLAPQPTDMNRLIIDMAPLLQRTLGTHITVEHALADGLWSANVDRGQMELAIINLAVNARDAMPDGGILKIETSNCELDEPYAARHTEVMPGQYVMITVTDTGLGMPPDVIEHAFEPGFTTKKVGKGTGLGLSMVFGFIKQSGGHIKVYSKVGIGTVVKLYVPGIDTAPLIECAEEPHAVSAPTGTETVLLVEDDPMVRTNASRTLSELGYIVLAAEDAAKALAIVESGTIPQLLFTDVVMPGEINGYQLSEIMRKRHPTLKVLFMSGYAHGVVPGCRNGNSFKGDLLGKPFRRRDLAIEVRRVLDSEDDP